MRSNQVDREAAPVVVRAVGAVNTDTVVTIDPREHEFWVLDWISWSYDTIGGNVGNVKVEIGGEILLDLDITDSGPGVWEANKPLYKPCEPKNEPMVVTLAAVPGAIGKMTVRHR